MTKHYALVDGLGKVIQTVQTNEELVTPWIEVTQPVLKSSMVYNYETGLFEEPSTEGQEITP